MPLEGTVAAIGFGGALISGTLGIGGALVLIPLLLYVPPAVSGTTLSVPAATGLSIVQVVTAGLVGTLVYGRRGYVDRRLLVRVGVPMAVAGLLGGLVSAWLPELALLALFAAIASLALLLLLSGEAAEGSAPPSAAVSAYVATGSGVGLVGGALGAGGAFLLIPVLVRLLRVPMRTAVGSSLGVTLVGTVASLAGKLFSGQVPLNLTPWAVLGTAPGVLLGASLSARLSPRRLRLLLAALVALVAARGWWDVAARLLTR